MIGCDCRVCTSADPKDKRLRSSILVRSGNTTICVDTGPDFRYQMLRAGVKNLDAVLFTHPHKDHVAGLDDVRAFNFFSGKAMPVYANELTTSVLMREFPYAFSEHKYPGVPEIELNIIDTTPFVIGDISIIPIMVWHLKMPVYGFRFGNFTYVTDANRIDAPELEKIKGSEVLVLNTLRKEKHISHFTLNEGIALAQSLNIPQTYFTHISHQMGLHEEVMKELPNGIELAYDGLEFSV
jgi:phosphoribosyl 1,2-cyclic phosphate phosphodiesterase